MSSKTYKRILLKLSGEALWEKFPGKSFPSTLEFIASEISKAVSEGFQIGVVIGGGNVIRGARMSEGMNLDRVTADNIGMLSTVINALMLREAIRLNKVEAHVMCAFKVEGIAKRFKRDKAIRKLEKGDVVIFAGGTGNPYFSTDTAAALRALEIGASALVKGSKVDGVYDKDPFKYPKAKRYDVLTYDEAIAKELGIMDLTAFSLLKNSNIPVIVYKMSEPGMLGKVLRNKGKMSLVKT